MTLPSSPTYNVYVDIFCPKAEDKQRLEKLQQQKLRTEDVYSSCDSDDSDEEAKKSNQTDDTDSSDTSDSDDDSATGLDSVKQKQIITTKEELTKIKFSRNKAEK